MKAEETIREKIAKIIADGGDDYLSQLMQLIEQEPLMNYEIDRETYKILETMKLEPGKVYERGSKEWEYVQKNDVGRIIVFYGVQQHSFTTDTPCMLSASRWGFMLYPEKPKTLIDKLEEKLENIKKEHPQNLHTDYILGICRGLDAAIITAKEHLNTQDNERIKDI